MLTLSTVENSGDAASDITTQLIIIVVLIIINAFFAASELAILSSNSFKIDSLAQENNKRAILVKKLKADETKFLSTIQVGITLAGFFSSATAAVSMSSGMEKVLSNLNIPFSGEIALVIVTLILSYFTLVFGELLPKRIALRSPEKIAMLFAKPINVIRIIFKPIVFLLSGSCELLVKLLHLNNNQEEKVTEEEVIALVSSGVEDGTINCNEQELINAVFSFQDLVVKDIMIPRINICMLNINDEISKNINIIKNEKYTRIPVYENNSDTIIGILNTKDLIFFKENSFTNENIRQIIRQPLFITENMKVENLFKKMQKNKNHVAIVIDEIGCLSGFITMEDIIEEIMGNIDDEYDESISLIQKIEENKYIIDGTISIHDLNKQLNLNIKKDNEQYVSLSGFITSKMEMIPIQGMEYDYNNIHFTILKVVNNIAKSIQIEIK